MSQAGQANPPSVKPIETATKRKGRFKALLIAVLMFGTAGLVWYGWWSTVGQYEVDTDNAYVAGNIVQVTPQTTGTVKAVEVNNTDRVKAGQVLVQLDETDAQVSLQAAEAALADAVRSVRGLYATTSQSNASVEQTRAEFKKAQHQVEQAAAQRRNARRRPSRFRSPSRDAGRRRCSARTRSPRRSA